MAAFLSACATKGEYVESDKVAQIKDSISTAEELEATLGPPSVAIPSADGKTIWIYEGVYVRPGVTSYIPYLNYIIGTNLKDCSRLSVTVDSASGRLTDWKYRHGQDEDHWMKTSEKCDKKLSD